MRFSLRNLLIVITLLFLLLPASQLVLDYIRRQQDHAEFMAEVQQLRLQLELERRVRKYTVPGDRPKVEGEGFRQLEEFLEAQDPLVPSSSP